MCAVQIGLLLLFEMNGWVVLTQLEGEQAAASTAPTGCVQSQKLTKPPHYTCTVSVIAFTPPMCVVPEAHKVTQGNSLQSHREILSDSLRTVHCASAHKHNT